MRDIHPIKHLRLCVPILGIVALAAMFLKLPEIQNIFGIFECKTCLSNHPYIPLIASGYFGLLIALSLLFPAFPSQHLGRGGLIWAILLAPVLTYINLPSWCSACLVGHVCNILIWGVWVFIPSIEHKPNHSTLGTRLCLTLAVPISVAALFSSLNLTVMAYGFKANRNVNLSVGDRVPIFSAQTVEGLWVANTDNGGMVLNFVAPDCSYCKEQLQVFRAVAGELVNRSYRFVNITPALMPELTQYSPAADWVEDKDYKLRKLFKIDGYPTMIVVGSDGKIARVIRGVPKELKDELQTSLRKGL